MRPGLPTPPIRPLETFEPKRRRRPGAWNAFRATAIYAAFAFGLAASAVAAEAPKLSLLSDGDAERYVRIFALQDEGDFKAADRLIGQIGDKLLLGHVRFQRYLHPTDYKSGFAELRAWLADYNDHPEAYRAFSLAMKRRPQGAARPKLPVYGEEHIRALVGEPPVRPAPYVGEDERIANAVRKAVGKGDNVGAERLLLARSARRALSAVQWDALAAHVAMGYYVDGKDAPAYKLAAAAAKRSGAKVAQANWVAGLASYRSGKLRQAVAHFEETARVERAATWEKSAGAFWAGRLHVRLGDPARAQRWFAFAAHFNRSFYGQLALYRLKASSPFDWNSPPPTQADLARLNALKPGKRALALLQIAQYWRADQELQALVEDAEPDLLRSIISVALAYGAPRASVQAAHRLNKHFEEFRGDGFYPPAPWLAPKETKIDRALAFAFMRQESQFNPRAVSPAGARGLMQLIPSTANYVIGEKRFVRARRDGLFDPYVNVNIASAYMRYLLEKDIVGGDIFRLAIAYNAGIGNLARWLKEMSYKDDPLLFIETIPNRETRSFISRTLANLWIYRERLGQPATSRIDIAQGRWPIYKEQD